MNEKRKEKANKVKGDSDLPVCSRDPLSGRQTSEPVSCRWRAASNYMGYRSSGPPTNTQAYCIMRGYHYEAAINLDFQDHCLNYEYREKQIHVH